jgi:hypothetical protein
LEGKVVVVVEVVVEVVRERGSLSRVSTTKSLLLSCRLKVKFLE